MKTALVVMMLLTGSADELAATTVGNLKLSVPAAWNKTDQGGGTTRFAAPSGEAYFEIDVGQVQRPGGMPAEECIQKIKAGIGGEWQPLSIGAAPAAVKQDVDTDEAGKQFISRTYVGCNGKTTWSISFHLVAPKKERFAPLADKVAQSVQYAR
jgi:hypothetical protein